MMIAHHGEIFRFFHSKYCHAFFLSLHILNLLKAFVFDLQAMIPASRNHPNNTHSLTGISVILAC